MQLKDCIHFYIGCEAEFIGYYNKDRFINILDGFDIEYIKDGNVYESVKPILRRLESMTGEECDKYNRISDSLFSLAEGVNQVRQASAAISYLINLGFDLFSLIESGEAIDQETLKKEP